MSSLFSKSFAFINFKDFVLLSLSVSFALTLALTISVVAYLFHKIYSKSGANMVTTKQPKDEASRYSIYCICMDSSAQSNLSHLFYMREKKK